MAKKSVPKAPAELAIEAYNKFLKTGRKPDEAMEYLCEIMFQIGIGVANAVNDVNPEMKLTLERVYSDAISCVMAKVREYGEKGVLDVKVVEDEVSSPQEVECVPDAIEGGYNGC